MKDALSVTTGLQNAEKVEKVQPQACVQQTQETKWELVTEVEKQTSCHHGFNR